MWSSCHVTLIQFFLSWPYLSKGIFIWFSRYDGISSLNVIHDAISSTLYFYTHTMLVRLSWNRVTLFSDSSYRSLANFFVCRKPGFWFRYSAWCLFNLYMVERKAERTETTAGSRASKSPIDEKLVCVTEFWLCWWALRNAWGVEVWYCADSQQNWSSYKQSVAANRKTNWEDINGMLAMRQQNERA